MKSLFLLALIFSAACISTSYGAAAATVKDTTDIAELKLSLSTLAINKLVSFLGDMVDNLFGDQPLNIPLNLDIKQKLGLYHIELNHFVLANHTIPWNSGAIAVNAVSANVFSVDASNISLNFTGYEGITLLGLIKIKNNFTLTLTDLTFSTTVHLSPNTNPSSIGFNAKVAKTHLKIGGLKLHLEDQKFWNFLAQPVVWILKTGINTLFSQLLTPILIEPTINKQLTALCDKPLQPEIKIGAYTYQFDINFPQGIQQQESDLRVPVNIKQITNLNSTEIAPVSQEVDIPSQYFKNYTGRSDLEILTGTGLINQLIWTVADSKLLTMTINQNSAIMQSIPLQLNLQGVQLLVPGLYNEYVIRKLMPPTTGVYLSLYVPNQIPNVRLVAGRLIGTINASIQFQVELNPDEYPVSDISKCDCDNAATVAVQLYFAADLYTPGQFKIGANVSDLQVVSAQKTSGAIDFDGSKFASNASLLISNLVGIINQQLSKGVDIPLVSQASFLEGITLIFEQGYIFIDVAINPNN